MLMPTPLVVAARSASPLFVSGADKSCSGWPLLLRGALAEKLPHEGCDLVAVRFEGEVAGVEEVVLQRLQVAFVRLGPLRWEDLVVLPPGDEHRGLVRAEVILPLRVERRGGGVGPGEGGREVVGSPPGGGGLGVGGAVRARPRGVLWAG